MKKVLLAMSGGVDSSVAALLLKKQGFSVIGVHMRLHERYEKSERAARAVCRQMGIKFYPVNLSRKFEGEVIDYFVSSYSKGRTPNPCVYCNRLLKFGELFRVADELGADYLATGHYARIIDNNGNRELWRGRDANKDQSYFLHVLRQDQLRRIIFPLGDFTKPEIRKMAEKNNLPNLPTESQDVCFLAGENEPREHNDYLREHLQKNPGPIKTLAGKEVGRHEGLYFYTRGQRKGIEIGGTGPYYAVCSDFEKNILYVTNNSDDPQLFNVAFNIKNANWINPEQVFPMDCEVMVRYRHQAASAKVFPVDNFEYRVELFVPERAITSGQFAVFYQGDKVLGGGEIGGI